jgi:hypothetical protein
MLEVDFLATVIHDLEYSEEASHGSSTGCHELAA